MSCGRFDFESNFPNCFWNLSITSGSLQDWKRGADNQVQACSSFIAVFFRIFQQFAVVILKKHAVFYNKIVKQFLIFL
jgi:hypothetical protein